jgi:YjbE family integral membrane protein
LLATFTLFARPLPVGKGLFYLPKIEQGSGTMEFFSAEFFTALLAIIFIDLVLAGDNAIVIALAARNLPKEQQKKVILWGTAGAIAIRAFATVIVVKLLALPGLMLIGGIVLIWISYKLLIEDSEHDIKAAPSMFAAIRTIIIADAAMGVDNVLAVAGAAHGSVMLVVLGLLISIPIVVWGSTLFIKWINRFPSIIYIGAGVLAFTAAKMITGEKFYLNQFFTQYAVLKWVVVAVIVFGVLIAGKLVKDRKELSQQNHGQVEAG